MKAHAIAAKDFLSFGTLELPLRQGTTIVTGPNGAGKSNLAAAIGLPLLVLDPGAQGTPDPLQVFEEAGRNGADTYGVVLDIELDQPWEKDLVRLFIDAAVTTAALNYATFGPDQPRSGILEMFASLGVTGESAQSLLRGKLHIAYSARHQERWWAAWNFSHNGKPFQLGLRGGGVADRLGRGHIAPWAGGAFNAFRTVVPPLGYPSAEGEQVPDMQGLSSVLRSEYSMLAGKDQPVAVDFPLIMDHLDDAGAYSMEVAALTNSNSVEPASLAALARALGCADYRQKRFTFRHVMAEILRRSLVPTDNRRLPLQRHFPVADLASPLDLRDGSAVAGELYRLKNGSPAEQQRFADIGMIFTDITQRGMQLRSTPAGSSDLAIDILVGDSGRTAQLEGAGVQEALLLATLIAGERGRVVVLDEPAVNLHPTMQRRLARHLADIHGIVITHSPDLVPCTGTEDLDRVVRLAPGRQGTRACSLPVGNRRRLGEWTQNLLLSDVRALLFASAVVLFEGATDLGALGQWWQDGTPGFSDPQGANIAFVNVGGDNNFGGYINYLQAFQIPWAAVADGPALWHRSGLARQLRNQGLAPDGPPDEDGTFEAWKAYWSSAGVFTMADTFGTGPQKGKGEFEAYLERLDPVLLEKAREEHGNSKPRVGAAFAAAYPGTPNEVADLYGQIRGHLSE